MGDELQRLGEQLRAARETRRLSLVQLAALSGVSKNHIAAAEHGQNISVRVLNKLAFHLGLKVLQLPELSLDVDVGRAHTIETLVRRAIGDLSRVIDEVTPAQKKAPAAPPTAENDSDDEKAVLRHVRILRDEVTRQAPAVNLRELLEPIERWIIGVIDDPGDDLYTKRKLTLPDDTAIAAARDDHGVPRELLEQDRLSDVVARRESSTNAPRGTRRRRSKT